MNIQIFCAFKFEKEPQGSPEDSRVCGFVWLLCGQFCPGGRSPCGTARQLDACLVSVFPSQSSVVSLQNYSNQPKRLFFCVRRKPSLADIGQHELAQRVRTLHVKVSVGTAGLSATRSSDSQARFILTSITAQTRVSVATQLSRAH